MIQLDCSLLAYLNKTFSANFYYVGGVVRDALLGIISDDIDIATDLEPEQLLEIAKNNNITAVPTGLQHGTVTILIDGKSLEITTFRQDLENNGRHAQVAFTKSMKIDAQRRDFTFNALYLDSNNQLYDFYSGVADLKKGRVKFIGEPADRISEDYLRVLRFCRFFADYDRGNISTRDEKTMQAIANMANKVNTLSADRITQECLKITNSKNYARSFALINSIPELNKLFNLKPIKAKDFIKPVITSSDNFFKLCLVYRNNLEYLLSAKIFNFSNKQKSFIKSINKLELFKLSEDLVIKNAIIYSPDIVKFYILSEYLNGKIIYHDAEDLIALLKTEIPDFLVKGQDLMDLGFNSGPILGELLKQVKGYWLENNYPTKQECLNFARKLLKSSL